MARSVPLAVLVLLLAAAFLAGIGGGILGSRLNTGHREIEANAFRLVDGSGKVFARLVIRRAPLSWSQTLNGHGGVAERDTAYAEGAVLDLLDANGHVVWTLPDRFRVVPLDAP